MEVFETAGISATETAAFANLSGDRNPIHIDPIAARRLLYGRTVVHGVHTVLRALDRWVAETGAGSSPPTRLRARFTAPLFADMAARIEVVNSTPEEHRLHLKSGHRELTTIGLERRQDNTTTRAIPAARSEELDHPNTVNENGLQAAHGQVYLSLDRGGYAHLFPILSDNDAWDELVAALLGTTYIVGMVHPGMHSLLAGFDISMTEKSPPATPHPMMSYRVKRHDPRFGMIDMEANSGVWQGSTTAFVRPAPAEQPSFQTVRNRVSETRFSGRHALVIGGSRGLGEVAAKIISASGGQVTITYRDGQDEARRVCADIADGGGSVRTLKFDVMHPADTDLSTLGLTPFSDILYFASPHIDSNTEEKFDKALFERFMDFYVHPLPQLLASLSGRLAKNVTLFWPSSAYIDKAPPGFEEYAAAKLAGEKACEGLAATWPGMNIEKPRLPPMRTDQTSAVVSSTTDEPLDVLASVLLDSKGIQIRV